MPYTPIPARDRKMIESQLKMKDFLNKQSAAATKLADSLHKQAKALSYAKIGGMLGYGVSTIAKINKERLGG